MPPPPPPADRRPVGDYDIVSNWGSGFTASMAVGASSAALNGWTVAFDASFNITSIWNATIVGHVGNHYVVKNVDWNGNVAGGKKTSFGFQATPGSGGTAGLCASPSSALPWVPTRCRCRRLSVADATVAEGNSGTHEWPSPVTLSTAATGPGDGGLRAPATAGRPQAATTPPVAAHLTFAAGETSRSCASRCRAIPPSKPTDPDDYA